MIGVFQTFARSLKFDGIATRREFWTYVGLYAIAAAGSRFVFNTVADPVVLSFTAALAGLVAVALPAAVVRRLHDTGRSGRWAFLAVVPVLGGLAVLVLCLGRGQGTDADWPPKPRYRAGQAMVLLLALVIVARAIWTPYWSPSGSMKPTLLAGDYFVASSWSRSPSAGDVVIYRHPLDGRAFVARVVALGGDTVEMRGGVPVLNGTLLVHSRAGAFVERMEHQSPVGSLPICIEGAQRMGGDCTKDIFVETLPNGRTYSVLNAGDDMRFDTTSVFTVPEGYVFLMGDNRDNSTDSRVPRSMLGPGYVPVSNILGKVQYILFSSSGTSLYTPWTWRRGRFFRTVQ